MYHGTGLANHILKSTKNRTMKTTRLYSVLMLIMAILFAFALQAERAIAPNGISDNPPASATESNAPAAVENIAFEEEEYVNDIPFNTALVKENYNYWAALEMNYYCEEEAYVEDIPFNTEEVAEHIRFEAAMNAEFEMEEESYINDIPFDTHEVADQHADHLHFVLFL